MVSLQPDRMPTQKERRYCLKISPSPTPNTSPTAAAAAAATGYRRSTSSSTRVSAQERGGGARHGRAGPRPGGRRPGAPELQQEGVGGPEPERPHPGIPAAALRAAPPRCGCRHPHKLAAATLHPWCTSRALAGAQRDPGAAAGPGGALGESHRRHPLLAARLGCRRGRARHGCVPATAAMLVTAPHSCRPPTSDALRLLAGCLPPPPPA